MKSKLKPKTQNQKLKRVEQLYRGLLKKHGAPKGQWRMWCKRKKSVQERVEIIIGAILTQRTNWDNVEMAISRLKEAGVYSLKDVYNLGLKNKKRLADLIKPSGFYKQKAGYLFGVAGFVFKNYGGVANMKRGEFEKLREELLVLKGIGQETADSILLYALDKPVFVIDEYTRRWVKRHKLAKNLSYNFLQDLFEKYLPRDYKLYQDFHALIVIEEKNRI